MDPSHIRSVPEQGLTWEISADIPEGVGALIGHCLIPECQSKGGIGAVPASIGLWRHNIYHGDSELGNWFTHLGPSR